MRMRLAQRFQPPGNIRLRPRHQLTANAARLQNLGNDNAHIRAFCAIQEFPA
jgi:hypothetical protein